MAPPPSPAARFPPASSRQGGRPCLGGAVCASSAAKAPSPAPAVVVGGSGRVGRALLSMCPEGTRSVGRGQEVPGEPGSGPVFVCCHNCDLAAVVEQTPQERRRDLVFLQNGMLRPWLAERGLEGNTQALMYMAAALEGDQVRVKDGGLTAAWGPWAGELARILSSGDPGVRCDVVGPWDEFAERAAEKHLWASIFWAVCRARGGITVGEAVTDHSSRADVASLAGEMLPLARGGFGCAALPPAGAGEGIEGVVGRLCDYSERISAAVPSVEMAVAEFEWRNGWLLGAGGRGAQPLHIEYLERAGVDPALIERALEGSQ